MNLCVVLVSLVQVYPRRPPRFLKYQSQPQMRVSASLSCLAWLAYHSTIIDLSPLLKRLRIIISHLIL